MAHNLTRPRISWLQTYESHFPFLLTVLVDLNAVGMGYVHLGNQASTHARRDVLCERDRVYSPPLLRLVTYSAQPNKGATRPLPPALTRGAQHPGTKQDHI